MFLAYFFNKNKNKNNEAIIVSAYLVSAEVVLRMTGGYILSEFVKYAIILFMFIGMFYKGFSKNSIPIWIYLLLLVPGIILSTFTISIETNLRKAIIFNIIGTFAWQYVPSIVIKEDCQESRWIMYS